MTNQKTIDLGQFFSKGYTPNYQEFQEWVVSGLNDRENVPSPGPETEIESIYVDAVSESKAAITRLQLAAHDLGAENLAISIQNEITSQKNEALAALRRIGTKLEHAQASGMFIAYTHIEELLKELLSD